MFYQSLKQSSQRLKLLLIFLVLSLVTNLSNASLRSLPDHSFSLHRVYFDDSYHFRWCDADQDPHTVLDCHVIGRSSGYTEAELTTLSEVIRKRVTWMPYIRTAQAITGLSLAAILFFNPARWMSLGLKPLKFGGSQIPIVPSIVSGLFLNASLTCFHEEFCSLKYQGEFGQETPRLIDPSSESLSVNVEKNIFYFASALDDLLTSLDRCGETINFFELSCEPRILKDWEKVVPMSGGITIDNGDKFGSKK